MSETLMSTYSRLPVNFVRGEGVWLWDTDNNKYLDAISGVAVCSLGHAHPAITEAICQQAGQLVHTSNLYGIPNQEKLGQTLCQLSAMDKVFFANSGAEANEAAIKLARLHGHQKGIEQPTVIVVDQSFHGRTLATLSASGNRKVQAGFEPLVKGFVRVPYDDLDAIQAVAKHSPDVVAILVEPVQGEGGVQIPADDYLAGLRVICDAHDWLLMLDEIQTGIGRTGKLFACQHEGVQPDVMTLAKALGNGVPIGACLARGKAAELFQPGSHGSTFGGNPLACSAALAVLDTMEKGNVVEHAAKIGEKILTDLTESLKDVSAVTEIRGKGMIIGIELDRPCAELVKLALEKGLLINVTAERVIRLLPPLIISEVEAGQLVEQLNVLIRGFVSESAAA